MLFVFFDNKEEIFKKHSFLNKVKQICTDLMNQLVKDEVEKLSVFDLEGPCLADLNEWAKGYRNDDEAVHRKGRYDGGTEEAEQVQMGVENEWDTKQSG